MNILSTWDRCAYLPWGHYVFSWMLSKKVPYTGSIKPLVRELRSGYCKVEMKDHKSLRNHLNSLHAIALINLGEVASGLAVLSALPPKAKGIVTHLEIDYFKKARGAIRAESQFVLPDSTQEKIEVEVVSDLFDLAGDRVASVKARWKLNFNTSF